MKRFHIFCDGGLGNRFNALASGLAAAKLLGLEPHVFWPANNWCRARFDEIFDSTLNANDTSLSELKGQIDGMLPLLHDEYASQTLGISFASAYAYDSIHALQAAADGHDRDLFYYPALIPTWLPAEALHQAIATLPFHPELRESATHFIRDTIGGPFYGLHLRRTDLKTGYSDAEVALLAIAHPDAKFFVCSDDPLAERICAAHSNVFIREKHKHVAMKNPGGGWNDATLDDDQRLYYGNIERGSDSVREAAIDMLVLAHSTILGYSGSTFQATARLIGHIAPLLQIERLPVIELLATTDCHRQLATGRLQLIDVIGLAERLTAEQRPDEAARFLQAALNHFPENQAFPICYNLSWTLMQLGRYGEADVFVERAIHGNPAFADTQLLAAQIGKARGDRSKMEAHLNRALELAHQEPDAAKRHRLETIVRDTLAVQQ